ncbi:hypothetical protein LOTGIDRAFT_231980 [Lottia gigantea]|uniref:Methyltransferase FkbM domain-containing protein n=1 Tax=Lottia gigantea TaxID=225164 RepID=V3ZWB6_LOTGI|nr:hypothetical protein LOTGIDRAFT_231980 [Lottia gigantea]ESO95818.1 hypothetical protein LOTGIDRAFT_231980 [Lottia gigantea]
MAVLDLIRQTLSTKIAKLVLCILLGVCVCFLFLSSENKQLVSKHSPNMLNNLMFKSTNNNLQQLFPSATCPIGVQLLKHDYPAISACTEGYSALERSHIDSSKMESQRVVIHKPYLTRNDSLLIEVGGYTGADAERFIAHGIRPHYIMLEPVPMFFNQLIDKFKNDPRFIIYNFGLGREDKVLTIPIQTDATSLFRQNIPRGKGTTDIKIRKSTVFFDEVGVAKKNVDLLHINCEGCEFELLEELIVTGYIRYFNHIQFQFHMHLPQIKQEACRYCQIMQLLTRTHTPMFQYRHTWQAWKKIEL